MYVYEVELASDAPEHPPNPPLPPLDEIWSEAVPGIPEQPATELVRGFTDEAGVYHPEIPARPAVAAVPAIPPQLIRPALPERPSPQPEPQRVFHQVRATDEADAEQRIRARYREPITLLGAPRIVRDLHPFEIRVEQKKRTLETSAPGEG